MGFPPLRGPAGHWRGRNGSAQPTCPLPHTELRRKAGEAPENQMSPLLPRVAGEPVALLTLKWNWLAPCPWESRPRPSSISHFCSQMHPETVAPCLLGEERTGRWAECRGPRAAKLPPCACVHARVCVERGRSSFLSFLGEQGQRGRQPRGLGSAASQSQQGAEEAGSLAFPISHPAVEERSCPRGYPGTGHMFMRTL